MIIGIDGNEANIKEKVGIHQYAFYILWGINNLGIEKDGKNTYIIYLKNTPRDDLPKESKYWKYKIIPGKGLWVLTKLMPYLWKSKNLDVFLAQAIICHL